MRTSTLLLFVFCFIYSAQAQTSWLQYPSNVISFSSQYSPSNWSAAQALGAPNTPGCGDIITAWASSSADGQREFLELGFSIHGEASRVRIFQTLAAGAIDTV